MNRCLTGLRRSVRAQVSCTFSVAQSLFLMGSSVRCAEFFLFFVAQSHPLSCRASKIIFFLFLTGAQLQSHAHAKYFFLSRCQLLVRSLHAQHFFIFFDPSIPWRAQYSFFSLCLLPLRWTACARQTFFFLAVHAEALLLFPCAVTFLRRVQFFVFLCLLPVSRTAGQPVRARFFYFLFFFLSLHARAEYFFFSRFLSACHFFCLVSRGVHADFFWVCMQSPVTSPLLGAAQFFFGHLCSVRSLLTAEQTCQGAMHIFFFLPPSTAVCAAFLFL